MLGWLEGEWRDAGSEWVIVDRSGVGWAVTPTCDPVDREPAEVWVTTVWAEASGPRFFAHDTSDARDLFNVVRSVHGIGGVTSATIIRQLGVAGAVTAIVSGDIAAFKPVKGVGPKTAARLISDTDLPAHLAALTGSGAAPAHTEVDEIAAALIDLGFDQDLAVQAVSSARSANPDMDDEALIAAAMASM